MIAMGLLAAERAAAQRARAMIDRRSTATANGTATMTGAYQA